MPAGCGKASVSKFMINGKFTDVCQDKGRALVVIPTMPQNPNQGDCGKCDRNQRGVAVGWNQCREVDNLHQVYGPAEA